MDQESAERELTSLIRRALRSVPYVRLDKVDEVIDEFKVALRVLEMNLREESDYSDEEINASSNPPSGGSSPFDNSRASPVDMMEKSLPTRDYSSPSLSARRLGGNQSKKNMDGDLNLFGLGKPRPGSSSLARGSTKDQQASGQKKKPILGLGSGGTGLGLNASKGRAGHSSSSLLVKAVGGAVKAKESITRDYSSPRLSARVLGAKKREPKLSSLGKTRSSRSQENSESESESNDYSYGGKSQKLNLAIATEESSTSKDSIGSPQQFRSNLILLNLASSKDDVQVETPKPKYLRRLDSPETHLGALRSSKALLHTMLSGALCKLPRLEVDGYEKVHGAFLKAVKLLENSTVAPQ